MYRPEKFARTLVAVVSYTALVVASAFSGRVYADDWFNPAFLARDGGEVADLSRFESGAGQVPGVYRVDIWMNDEFITTRDMRFEPAETGADGSAVKDGAERMAVNHDSAAQADDSGLTPCLTLKWLKRLGVDTYAEPELKDVKDENQCVDFMRIYPGAGSHYDFPSQKLMLTFPQAALQNSIRGYIPPEEWEQGINAGLLSYSMTGSKSRGSDSYYLNLTSGLNLGAWRLRNNGAGSYFDSDNGYRRRQWQKISTYAERTVIPLKSELVLGDSNSSGELFDSVGFRGVRLFSSDPMYPDSQQGYAPTIRGIAAGRSKVTVRQNGYVIYQNTVQSGAFEINDLNPTSSSGDLEVTVESDAGNVQKFVVPYSTVPLLLREGRLKFDLVAGRYRSGQSGKGDPVFVEGTLARGFQNGMTLFGGTQLAKRYTAASVGLGHNLGNWGALSTDVTTAQSELADGSRHNGQSIRFLYAKSLNQYGTTFQLLGYRYSTQGFYTLDEVAWDEMSGYQYEWKDDNDGRGPHYEPISYHSLRRSKKGRFQVSVSQQINDIGSLSLSATHQDYWNAPGGDKWYMAGFASTWHGVSYNLSYSLSQSTGMPGKNRLLSLNAGTTGGSTLRSYVTTYPTSHTEGRLKYISLNEYMEAAISIHDSYAGTYYPPANYVQMGSDANVHKNKPFKVRDSNLDFIFRIKKPFVGRSDFNLNPAFSVYVTTKDTDPLSSVVYLITYTGTITVPQSCELNTGQTISFDFGNIGAATFSQAGAGNKPAGVNPQTRVIGIQCKNMEAKALLSLRLETNEVSGNAMVSDNNDLGFVVADGDKNPLMPNNIDSNIPFQLDGNASASVPITAWPVSITGKKPAEGKFTAEGYLRVDFD